MSELPGLAERPLAVATRCEARQVAELPTLQNANGALLPALPQRRKGVCACSWRFAWILLSTVAVLLTGSSAIGLWCVTCWIDRGINTAAVIDGPSTAGFGRFQDSYTFFVVTFFNITNAVEVLQEGAKPKLVEVGPFVYRSYQQRKEILWDAASDTVSYRQHTWMEFDRNETLARSGGNHSSDTDVKVTTLNLLFSGLRVQASRSALHLLGSLLWKHDDERLFEERTPRELLEGYNVTFKVLDMPVYSVAFPGLVPNLPLAKDPDMTHRTVISVGRGDAERTFQYLSWEEQTEVQASCPYGNPLFPFSHCGTNVVPCCGQKEPVPIWDVTAAQGQFDADANAVHGTTGEQFRRGLSAGDSEEHLQFFFSIARRSMPLVSKPGDTESVQGVEVRVFRPEYAAFWANATERPANARYYQWGPSGLLNLTMIYGGDVFMSPAHFLGCDSELLDGVEGLSPEPGRHDFRMGVEPATGITIMSHSTVMLGARISSEGHYGMFPAWFPKLSDHPVNVPVAWFDLEIPPLPKEALDAFAFLRLGQRLSGTFYWALWVGGVSSCALFMLGLMRKLKCCQVPVSTANH